MRSCETSFFSNCAGTLCLQQMFTCIYHADRTLDELWLECYKKAAANISLRPLSSTVCVESNP